MTPTEAQQALAECRRRIDAIDRELRDLLNKRTEIVVDVLRMKDELGLPIQEPNREQHVIRNVTDGNPGPLPNESVQRLFECLMHEMREFQKLRRTK
jgi:chorismate mutase-like protein